MLGNPQNNKTKVVNNNILCLSIDVFRNMVTEPSRGGRLSFCLYLNDLQCIHRILNIHLQTYEAYISHCVILATLQDNIY